MSMASQMCQIPVTCIIFCCNFREFRLGMYVLIIPDVTDFDISWGCVEHTLIKGLLWLFLNQPGLKRIEMD
jgi:hypothetical protein